MTRWTIHFSGSVQGVGFRYTTVQLAEEFEVAGYVQNLSDGRVRLVMEGEAEPMQGLLDAIAARFGRYIKQTARDESASTGEFGKPSPGGIRVRY